MRSDPFRLTPGFYPWRLPLETRYGDMDDNAHLNNVAIARFYEEARVRFHASLRTAHPEIGDLQTLVAHLAIDYLAEGQYPQSVELGLGVLSFGSSSYRVAMGLFQGGHCIGLCDSVLVYRDGAGPAPISPALRAALGEWAVRG